MGVQKREAFANDLYLFLGILLAGNRDDVMKVHRRSNLLSEQFRTEVTQPPTHILSNNFFALFNSQFMFCLVVLPR